MLTLEQKILEARRFYVATKGVEPECVVIDDSLRRDLDPKIFDANLLTIAGMHVIFADSIPHRVVRCGRMR